jgi:hypothetical protein
MTRNQEYIYQSIHSQVLMGFLPIDEIKECVIEEIESNEFEDEISEEWANQKIEEETEKLLTESKNWKNPTDTEKLIEVFEELCKMKIIALHCAGFTTSDGEAEVVGVEEQLNEKGVSSIGYCFYHEQDLMGAIDTENPQLYIAFQKINNSNSEVAVEVGKKIVTVLKNHNFSVEWNETVTTKILIRNFKWQKVYNDEDRNLLNYDEVVKLMTE